MKKLKHIIIFMFFNYLALGIGSMLMNNGPQTDWYLSLNKAPWTPKGWVFGVAWTGIMFCFAFYMSKLSSQYRGLDKQLLFLYTTQWFLNVSWNYIFFNQHLTIVGLVVIILLWLLIGYMTFKYITKVKWGTLLIMPYLAWLAIATSLNAYIVLNN